MTALIWTTNVFGWPVIHLAMAGVFLCLPVKWFQSDSWLTAPRHWEHEGRVYRDRLAIRKWKGLLPDGAPWIGGFAKKQIRSHDSAYLNRFLLETRRAELAHWCTLAWLPFFFLWNPSWACWVMTLYALAANLPCILAQRYNRFVLSRVTATSGCSFVRG
jgi:glycosyl-4,4'-diaponeurosporenoate acyltransferase